MFKLFHPRAVSSFISRGIGNKFDGCVARHPERWNGMGLNAQSTARDTWRALVREALLG
jgi:hypothetical protein